MAYLGGEVNALDIKKISVNFGGVKVLYDCSFSVGIGEKRALIGPNGAGKTTLFNIINGVIKPDEGEICLFDQNIITYPAHKRAALGLARTFQITNLFSNLTVLENVFMSIQALTSTKYLFYRRTSFCKEMLQLAESQLKDWGIWSKRDQQVRNLSHGEQRQLEIILALSGNPKVVLLDEPTQGLSPAETAMVIPMIKRIDSSTTILFIEHDMDVAFKLADKISVLHQGRILAEGMESQIRNNRSVAQVYLGMGDHHA